MSTREIRKLIRNGANPIPQPSRPSFVGRLCQTPKGAFGGPEKRQRRLAALAESSRQANEISKARQLKRAYAKFYATREGKAFAKTFGKNFQDDFGRARPPGAPSPDPEFHDPAELPQASVRDHPVDHIEPQDSHSFFPLPREEINIVCDTFKHVFRWALDGAQGCNGDSPLVCVGKRCNVVISRMRPDLGAGLTVDEKIAARFDSGFKADILLKTGVWFGRVLEWLRRGDPLSARGERVYLLAYQLWPAEINARTLASLGGMNGKTRQAKDKQSNCLRDTLSGLKAITMRADVTRARCRESQLNLETRKP